MESVKQAIRKLAEEYSARLKIKMKERKLEMKQDDKSHYLIYRVLGIGEKNGELIDIYQNKGRFLYKYAGSFLERASILCINHKYPDSQKNLKIPNTLGARPKTFEIDCLIGKKAIEIKWRDATTDGDHITKEHTRIKAIKDAGFTPIRVMFYYPNRVQAIRIQDAIKTLYHGVDGEYYARDDAWSFIKKFTGVNLKGILEEIAKEETGNA